MRGFKNEFSYWLIIAAVSISIVGCSDWFKGPVVWSEGFGGGRVVGFANDTLAFVVEHQSWRQSLGQFVQDHGELSGIGHQRLCIYNYRVQEDGPRWCDTLDNRLDNGNEENYARGQMTDSIIWGGDVSKSIKLWKLGESPHKKSLKLSKESCAELFGATSVKQWLNGTFIARGDNSLNAGGDSCQYAVLDTVAKTIIYKRLDGEWKWIGDCDDVMAQNENVYCLALDKKNGKSFIMKNGRDSILGAMDLLYEGAFWGNMLELGIRICSLVKDTIACLDIKWTGNRELEFYRDDGEVIYLK